MRDPRGVDGIAAADVRTLFVPGRVEVLGKHTDYCGGRSAICAIDRGFHVAFAPAADARVRLFALDTDQTAAFDVSPGLTPRMGGWDNYPMTVARRLARNFPGPLRGVTLAFSSTLPQAAGMSSSSALVVAMFLALDAANSIVGRMAADGALPTPQRVAEYLGTIENGRAFGDLAGDRGVGTFGGSEDHAAITLGRRDHVARQPGGRDGGVGPLRARVRRGGRIVVRGGVRRERLGTRARRRRGRLPGEVVRRLRRRVSRRRAACEFLCHASVRRHAAAITGE